MTDEPFYPPIQDALVLPLKVAVKHARDNSAYLDNPNCPYPPKLKDFIRELTGVAGTGGEAGRDDTTTFLDPTVDKFEAMMKELDRLYTDLKAFRSTLGGMEPNEKATFFKTTMSLLEKIASLQERIYNMKEMADFQKTVITVMEGLEPELRNEIIGGLNGYLR
jgi:hypothetical protein